MTMQGIIRSNNLVLKLNRAISYRLSISLHFTLCKGILLVYLTLGTLFRNLAISENVLDTTTAYTFHLKVTSANFGDLWGYSKMRLPANQPPTNGTCTVNRDVVQALVDPVTIVCDKWVDEDGGSRNNQLTYNFFVERFGSSDDWYPLYRGPRNTTSFYLAPWIDSAFVKVYMYVEDRQGGKTLANEE